MPSSKIKIIFRYSNLSMEEQSITGSLEGNIPIAIKKQQWMFMCWCLGLCCGNRSPFSVSTMWVAGKTFYLIYQREVIDYSTV